VLSSDLSGVNPATLNGMILYYRLMTKRSGLGDSTELSQVGLSHRRLVLCEVRPGPTDVEPLVDPHLEQERAP
jgi:hypothetical protein